jgi:hypothetical protein
MTPPDKAFQICRPTYDCLDYLMQQMRSEPADQLFWIRVDVKHPWQQLDRQKFAAWMPKYEQTPALGDLGTHVRRAYQEMQLIQEMSNIGFPPTDADTQILKRLSELDFIAVERAYFARKTPIVDFSLQPCSEMELWKEETGFLKNIFRFVFHFLFRF